MITKNTYDTAINSVGINLLVGLILFILPSVSVAQTQKDQRGLDLKRLETKEKIADHKFNQEPRFALIIGVNEYKYVRPLKGAVNDAKNLADALTKVAGFPADQVVLLTSEQSENKQPTKKNITANLELLAKKVPANGLLLVAFAGHGLDIYGARDQRLNGLNILPMDVRFQDEDKLSGREEVNENLINLSWITDLITASGVKQAILILDTCRVRARRLMDPEINPNVNPLPFYFKLNREVETFAVLYATSDGAPAYESGLSQQGYMTTAVVRGLMGEATGPDGKVTLGSLVKYVQNKVPELSSNNQRPFTKIEGFKSEELILSAPKK